MDYSQIEDIYALSPMQQGMLFHTLYAPDSGMYCEVTSCKLVGNVDVAAFQQAWQLVLQRHPILRTAFLWEGVDEPVQVVLKALTIELHQADWTSKSPDQQEKALDEFLRTERSRGFDLAQAPLMRLALFRLSEKTFEFVWSHHHILFDGWSLPILLEEFFQAYAAFQKGMTLSAPAPRPFRDYIAWIQQQDAKRTEVFWRKKLQDFSNPSYLPGDGINLESAGQFEHYEYAKNALSEELSEQLRGFCQKNGITLNTLLLGAWAILLSRYTRQQDIVFGGTVSGRPTDLEGADAMVGLFINTLPVRIRVLPAQPVVEFLTQIQSDQSEVRQFEYSPLAQVQSWGAIPAETPLFNNILVFENYPISEALKSEESVLNLQDVRSFSMTNYPLTLVASPARKLGLEMAYDTSRFSQRYIDQAMRHLQHILISIMSHPSAALAAIEAMDGEEQNRLVVDWNDTDRMYENLHIIDLFEDTVRQAPHSPAIWYQGQELSYEELNTRANQLAHYLQKNAVGPDSVVGICLGRSPELFVALWGVLKAGGAYLPLDPNYPPVRLNFMVQSAKAQIVLTTASLQHLWQKNQSAQIVSLDRDWPLVAQEPDGNPTRLSTPDHLAYIIFTSGTTGLPKGSMVSIANLTNHALSFREAFALKSGKRVMQYLNFTFDAAGQEIFPCLISGATLMLHASPNELTTKELQSFCQDNQVALLHLPVSVFHQVITESLEYQLKFSDSLEIIAAGGEAPSPESVLALQKLSDHPLRFFNCYGPTEAAIAASYHAISTEEFDGSTMRRLAIGRPIANVKLYLLDDRLQPVPMGVPGELYIGGVGVSRGYLNESALTAEKFLPDPFTPSPGARLYRTGDIACLRWDGDLEFIERMDEQVKIRGFRIELSEIEYQLTQIPEIQNAVVLARNEGRGSYLVAYYLLKPGVETESSEQEIRNYLKQRLPDYMVPTFFMVLSSFPLSATGKIDRKALPVPSQKGGIAGFTAPRTPVEDLLAGMWSKILGIGQIGIFDNFFSLGGHSLTATQLLSRIRETFQIDLSLKSIFESSNLAELARTIELQQKQGKVLAPQIEPDRRTGELPLSFAQQRLWFLDQLEPNNSFYNIPMAFRILGHVDINLMERCINEIIARHEVLRTRFRSVGGQAFQEILPELTFVFRRFDLREAEPLQREEMVQKIAAEEAQAPFDLAQGPLLRGAWIELGEEDCVLLFTMHHIVSDGWSISVMVNEMMTLYEAFSQNQPSPLMPLPIQYADFAIWQKNYLSGQVMQEQIQYWKEHLEGIPPLIELPTDHPRPSVQTFHGTTQSRLFSPELSQAIVRYCREENSTLFMTMLAGMEALLSRYSRQSDFCIGTPIANRHYLETEKLIGFFVNTLVMRANLQDQPSFSELVARVRDDSMKAFMHQDIPFEFLVDELHPRRDMSHSPIFQVMFVMQNMPLPKMTLKGMTLSPLSSESDNAKFDLTFIVEESGGRISVSAEYNTDLFEEATIAQMLAHYEMLCSQAMAHPDTPVALLPLLAETERVKTIMDWNQTQKTFPDQVTVAQWFESLAASQPDSPAMIYKDITLSYAELNRKANQLARYLIERNVSQEALVGICMDRSPEMIVGILAALKTGGAFVPLDPYYPPERLAFMISDSNATIILTQERWLPQLSSGAQLIAVDAVSNEIAALSDENLARDILPENLAYVIYTSGSTGRPKGTMLQHRGLCNLAQAQQNAFHVGKGSRILQFSSLSFDASVWEFVMALLSGATLVLTDREVLLTGQGIAQIFLEQRITTVTLPPSVLAVIPKDTYPDLQTVITAGEKCTGDLVANWAPGRQFYNAYGPTETTVCASMHLCVGEYPQGPPIGKPIDNSKIYILDEYWQIVPIGVPGELCVGGVGLARGYLSQPDLTAERFIPNPFAEQPGERLYRTGDLVKYLPNGDISFLGRIDFQVKVRGFRIELGEIESVLSEHPAVVDVAVLARNDFTVDTRLVAYLVIKEETPVSQTEMKTFLRSRLPEYMVPSVFMILKEMPLNPSGKIDRKRLPVPDQSRPEMEVTYVAPRNPIEQKLADICANLLGIEKVGIYDNFFDLGGHSLLATQFMSRIRDEFQIELPLRTLFEKSVVSELALEIDLAQRGDGKILAPSITSVDREKRRVKLSSLQINENPDQQ